MEAKMNWFLQSIGVDFYDMMLICNQWLFNEYKIEARLSYFLQNELRYIVKDNDK